MKNIKKKLTPKQKRFCEEYMIDLNGTQAAIRAGYSKKTAQEIASQNLSKLIIQEEIQKLLEKQQKRTEVTADMVVKELAKIGFSDMVDFIDVDKGTITIKDSKELTEAQRACISEITASPVFTFDKKDELKTKVTDKSVVTKLKLHNKVTALDLLGKHFGIFIDKHELTGKDGEPLIVNIVLKDKKENT